MPDVKQKSERMSPVVRDSKPPKPAELFVFRRCRTYTRYQLVNEMGVSPTTIAVWRKNGLQPLNTGTEFDYYWGGDLLRLWKSDASMKRTPPKTTSTKKGTK